MVKTKTTIAIAGFLIVAVAALIYLAPHQFSLASGCGYNVLSVSDVDYRSNDNLLNYMESILVFLVHNSQNECAYGFVSKDTMNADPSVPEEKTLQYDFAVRVESLEQSCQYRIQSKIPSYETRASWKGIHQMTYSRSTCERVSGGCDNYVNTCKQKVSYHSSAVTCFDLFSLNCDATCFFTTPIGWYGEIGNPKYSFPVNISIENSQGSVLSSAELNGESAVSAVLDDSTGKVRAYAEWNGYLVSGVSCPEAAANYIGAYDLRTGLTGWVVSKKITWNDYDAYDKSIFQSCTDIAENAGTAYYTELDKCMTSYNTKANKVLSDSTVQWDWAGSYVQDTTGTDSEGRVKLIANKPLKFPAITLHIDATWLGIYSPVGIPKITGVSPSSLTFESGTGRLTASVKNVGTAAGTFTTTATCTSGFFSSSDTSIVQPGVTANVPITISSTCTTQLSGSCTVKTQGKTQSDTWATAIQVTCTPLPECTNEGERRCSFDASKVQICRSGKWATDQSCDLGCVLQAGTPKCRTAACTRHEDCNDNDPCTYDTCSPDIFGNYACVNTPLPNCGFCGDKICDAQRGENYLSCAIDCGQCGNKVCQAEAGENYQTCPADCPQQCGNGVCEAGEAATCSQDCGGGLLLDWVFWSVGIISIILVSSLAIRMRMKHGKHRRR